MQRMGRSRIYCSKLLPSGFLEYFYVTVLTARLQECKSHYKERGYAVQDVN